MKPYIFHITLFDLAFLVAIIVGINFSLLLWFNKRTNHSANMFLALALMVGVLWTARIFGIDIGLAAIFSIWAWVPFRFSLAFGPLIYLYVLKIARPEFKLGFRDLLHFSPLLLELGAQLALQQLGPKTPFSIYLILALFYCCITAIMFLFIRTLSFLIKSVPAIILTKDSIALTESGYVIKWEDIDEINYVKSNGNGGHYIVKLEVRDPKKYIEQTPNKLQRFYRRTTFGFLHNPFVIGDIGMEGSLEKIFAVIDEYYQKYGNKYP